VSNAIDATPTAIGDPNAGNVAVYYTSNGVLMYKFYFGAQNSWAGPFTLATGAKGAPIVRGSPNAGNIAVLFMVDNGSGNELREDYYTVSTNSWTGAYALPGGPARAPVAAIGDPNKGNLALFMSNGSSEHNLMVDTYLVANNAWSGPFGIGCRVKGFSQPAAVGDPNGGNIAVFFAGLNNALMLNYFVGSTQSWTFPMVIGGTIT
jgi:hypothetical protein